MVECVDDARPVSCSALRPVHELDGPSSVLVVPKCGVSALLQPLFWRQWRSRCEVGGSCGDAAGYEYASTSDGEFGSDVHRSVSVVLHE